METLPVQSAGALASVLPASSALGGAPTADDSFTLTLGRILANMPSPVADGSAIAPQASPRAKGAASDSPDPAAMAGILINCFVSNILPPAPSVTRSAEAPASTASAPNSTAASTADSTPSFASSLNTSAGQPSASTVTPAIPAAMGGVTALTALSAWAGKGVAPAVASKAEPPKSAGHERTQMAAQPGDPVSTTAQNQPEDAAAPQTVSAAFWLPGVQTTPLPSQTVEQPVGGAPAVSEPAPAVSAGSAQELEPRQESQTSYRFMAARPQVAEPGLAQAQSALPTLSNRGLQAASQPTLPLRPTKQAAPASATEGRDFSPPVFPADHPTLAEFSSRLGMFAATDVRTASNPLLSSGQTKQTAPASRPVGRDSSTPASTADHPTLAEFSSRLGIFAGAHIQVASGSTPSSASTEQAAPALALEGRGSSTPVSTNDYSELAEVSIRVGMFAETDARTASNLTLSSGPTAQAAPASVPAGPDSSPPISATDQPGSTAYSSWMRESAGPEVQSDSNPTVSLVPTEQAAVASGPEASNSPSPPSAIGHPALAEFSSQEGKYASGEITIKVPEKESRQAPEPEKSTTRGTPVSAGPLRGDLWSPAPTSIPVPAASKSENLMDIPAKGTLHSALVSTSVAAEVAGQKGSEPEAASASAPLSSSASPVPPQPLDANSQPATAVTTWQKDAPPEATGIQPSGMVSTDSGESSAHTNLADSSTSGQGKSRQQSGPAPADDPVGVKTFAPSPANISAADSTASLLTAHAPIVLASHTNTAAPQAPPPSNQPPTTLSAWQNYDGGAGRIVRAASLNETANGAEMHVELRSGTLGPLEVHAVLNEGTLGAEIHVQGQEAHTLLAAGLPSLERALGERNLRVENIAVYQDQTGGGLSGGEKQNQQSSSYPSAQHQALPWNNLPQPSRAARGSAEDEELENPATGLSVRA